MSGGERKRVTLAEMLVGGRGALFLDEISTGLDSATLYNIVNTLGRLTRWVRWSQGRFDRFCLGPSMFLPNCS